MATNDVTNYKKWVIEAIDHIKNRKARPDAARICNFVVRQSHYSGTTSEIEAALAELVESEDVIRFAVNGSISYRNANRPKKKEARINILNTRYASRCIKEAITHFIDENPTQKDTGVSHLDIADWLIENGDDESHAVHKYIQFVLRQMVNDRVIYTRNNETYFIERENAAETSGSAIPQSSATVSGVDDVTPNQTVRASKGANSKMRAPAKAPAKDKTSKTSAARPAPKSPNPKSKRGRPPGKRKRFKKSHGPDFVEEYASSLDSQCDYCLSNKNKSGQREGLIYCKDCNAKAHPSCMKYSDGLAQRARNSPWQCIDCKTCYVCEDSGEPDMMLFCDACDKGYHMDCHNPPLSEKPQGAWVCSKCVLEGIPPVSEESSRNQSNDNGYLTPRASPTSSADAHYATPPKLQRLADHEIPDASDWGITDVADFFTARGFTEQAESFREQEIDGKSLLLLKRNDVLTGLSMKLGPALKIYSYVEKLQLVSDFTT